MPEVETPKNNTFSKFKILPKSIAHSCLNTRVLPIHGGIKLLDESTGLQMGPFRHPGYILVAAISADKKKVLTGSKNNTAILWDAESLNRIYKFKHNDWVTGAIIFSDKYGEYALTGSFDGTAVLWDTKTGVHLCRFNHGNIISTVETTKNGHIKTCSLTEEKIWPIVHFKMLSFRQFLLAIKLQRCLEAEKNFLLKSKWKKIFDTLPEPLKIKYNQIILKDESSKKIL